MESLYEQPELPVKNGPPFWIYFSLDTVYLFIDVLKWMIEILQKWYFVTKIVLTYWEKIVVVIENFEIKSFKDSNSERSEEFLITECFFIRYNKLEQLEFKLEKIIGRGVSGGWAGWAIAHPVFDRIEGRGAPHYYLPTQFLVATYVPDWDLETCRKTCCLYKKFTSCCKEIYFTN